jgi:type IV secretion system protein VirB10
MSVGAPLQLDGPGRSVVRLNRRVIYVVGAVLIIAVLAALVAIRAQGPRSNDGDTGRRAALAPRSQPWFQGIPDHTPAPRVAPLETAPPAPAPAPKAPSADEDEAARQRRLLRAAMSAPIGVNAFERRTGDHAARRTATQDAVAAAPAGTVVPADQAEAPGTPTVVNASMQSPGASADRGTRNLPADYLRASVRKPMSPYEVKAGTIIPAVMLTAINSDLPGQITGQVRENVYDSDTGEHLLIPQGTRLVGLYDHHIAYGQQRVLITWKRLILPNGSSLSLRDGMPGADAVGAGGFHDQVNNHYLRIFGHALLMSVISAGAQLSQIPQYGQSFAGPSAGNVLGGAMGQQLGSATAEVLRRGMNVSPTLEIRPGFVFNVMVTQDVIFPGPYQDVSR